MSDLPTLEEVDAYPVPELLVPRIMRVHNRDQEFAERIVKEAKRMLYLRNLAGQPVTPSLEIDDAWHEMLMFTRFYQEFCEFVGGFVHHNPTPPRKDDDAPPPGESIYDKTLKMYKEHFGEVPDPSYWTP